MQSIFEPMTLDIAERCNRDWQAAEDALDAAKKMAAGPERIAALRRAGQLRFDAYERRRAIQDSLFRWGPPTA
jgi:hypothetical protein